VTAPGEACQDTGPLARAAAPCDCADPIAFGHRPVCADGGYRQNDPAPEMRRPAPGALRAVRAALRQSQDGEQPPAGTSACPWHSRTASAP
jgi:hypothetical protein